MGMLDRYKKKGGFVQLLNLMETCGPQKQEKFFKIIEEESPLWAESVRSKMLSIQKIFSWDENTIAEIMGTLNEITIAVALLGLDEASKNKVFSMMGHFQKRKIETIIEEKKSDSAEISTAYVQIINQVRTLIKDGHIRIDKIDPSLTIDSSFEDQLLAGGIPISYSHETLVSSETPSTIQQMSQKDLDNIRDLEVMRKRLLALQAENSHLKATLAQAQHKLDQIKKIA